MPLTEHLPVTAEPEPAQANPFIQRLEAHLRERADARARRHPFKAAHAAAKAARAALKMPLLVLLVVASTTAGFFAAGWADDQRSKDADALGRQFLADRHLDMGAFIGPIVRASPGSKTIYTWVSISPGKNLRLDVGPGGNLVCLYQVVAADKLTPLDCSDKP